MSKDVTEGSGMDYDGYQCGPRRPSEPDSAERIVRELSIGIISEKEAVRRIERLVRGA